MVKIKCTCDKKSKWVGIDRTWCMNALIQNSQYQYELIDNNTFTLFFPRKFTHTTHNDWTPELTPPPLLWDYIHKPTMDKPQNSSSILILKREKVQLCPKAMATDKIDRKWTAPTFTKNCTHKISEIQEMYHCTPLWYKFRESTFDICSCPPENKTHVCRV